MDKNPPMRQASRLENAFVPGGLRFLRMSRSFSGGGTGTGLWSWWLHPLASLPSPRSQGLSQGSLLRSFASGPAAGRRDLAGCWCGVQTPSTRSSSCSLQRSLQPTPSPTSFHSHSQPKPSRWPLCSPKPASPSASLQKSGLRLHFRLCYPPGAPSGICPAPNCLQSLLLQMQNISFQSNLFLKSLKEPSSSRVLPRRFWLRLLGPGREARSWIYA